MYVHVFLYRVGSWVHNIGNEYDPYSTQLRKKPSFQTVGASLRSRASHKMSYKKCPKSHTNMKILIWYIVYGLECMVYGTRYIAPEMRR